MHKGKKHIKSTDLNSFQKYLNKEMNEREEHAFEKQILKDAFESDALDGLSTLAPDELSGELSTLHRKLIRSRRVFGYRSALAVAASIVLVLGLVSVLWFFVPEEPLRVSQSKAPVEHENTYDEREEAQMEELSVSDDEDVLEDVEVSEIPVVMTDKVQAPLKEVRKKRLHLKPINQVTVAKSEEVKYIQSSDSLKGSRVEQEIMKVDYGTLRGEPLYGAVGSASTNDLRVIQGKVLDKDQRPIAGANIYVKGTQVATVANTEGKYKMQVPVNDTSKPVVVDFIGFMPQQVVQNTEDSMNFIMEEEYYALSEVITVNTPEEEQRRINEFIPAEPEGGMDAYIISIEKELRYPKKGKGKKVQVVVSVTIGNEGDIKDIKIKRSPDEAYSIEVIRAIRNGAKWQAATNRGFPSEDKVKLKFTFTP